ncbi:MAG TPA: polysaccharide biosynthesis C-terminal domain-containing protein [Pyrinomonadaceae bacterium]|nr:polysaccharide biosynthesis C-terminal domain-containing protein [Pyrinomonadaceae bacterium]
MDRPITEKETGRGGDGVNVAVSPRRPVSGSRFSTQVAWTFAARVLMIFNSVVAGIIVARWLGAEAVGELAVINVAVATVVQFGTLGLPSSNTYVIAQNPERLRAAAINSLIFVAVVGPLLGLGLSALASIRPDLFGFVSLELIRIAAISVPFQLLTLIGLNILLAMGKVREFNLLDLAGQSFALINAVVALVVLEGYLLTLVLWNTMASILTGLAVALLLAISAKRLTASKWRADMALFGRMIQYGLKFHVSILMSIIIIRADLLVVNHYRGAAEAGVYSVASQFGLLLMLLPGVIATLLFPRVTAEQDARGETTCQVTRYTTFIMFLCCVGAVPLSLLLPVLYGAAFSQATGLLLILLPGVYLIGLESVLVQHFNALGLPRAIPIYWVITLVLNLILVFTLVPRYGAQGAAIASTISYAAIFALVALHFHTSTGRSFSEVFVLRSLRG